MWLGTRLHPRRHLGRLPAAARRPAALGQDSGLAMVCVYIYIYVCMYTIYCSIFTCVYI